ncbi:hypothetical protein POM88_050240 [Heracleum sosnowskyi]|uniref:Uncharacterized protein n=1 Tax=Heracleum sosnowskyi TaxID=360622 RepID=A0AAD8GZD6_9APIA|nr:hypothetical protein POM88_050240 [Heracleum sosnowskyi]
MAAVCTVIVGISLVVGRLLHYTGKYLKKKNQKPLFEALQKIKEGILFTFIYHVGMGCYILNRKGGSILGAEGKFCYISGLGQHHLESMGMSACHLANGVPAPGNFHRIRMNSGNDMVLGNSAADSTPGFPPGSAMSCMSEMVVSPTLVMSGGHFPFTASEISGMGVDTSALDSAFTSDVANSASLQLGEDNGEGNSRDSLRSLAQIPWSFSLSDLTADLSNLGERMVEVDKSRVVTLSDRVGGSADSTCAQVCHSRSRARTDYWVTSGCNKEEVEHGNASVGKYLETSILKNPDHGI